MIYEVLQQSPATVRFVTHPKAQRGRGILYATAPYTIYLLAVCALFVLAVRDLTLFGRIKQAAGGGFLLATALAVGCFLIGRRVRDRIDVTPDRIDLHHTPAVGSEQTTTIARSDLDGLAIDPSLRSLGADVLLVAVHKDGRRLPIAEGEPHSPQVRDLAADLGRLLQLKVESPRYTQ